MTLTGLVANRAMYEGTPLQTKPLLVLEKEPGGQFLILHTAEGADLDFAGYAGQWVEIQGELWTKQAVVVRAISVVDRPAE